MAAPDSNVSTGSTFPNLLDCAYLAAGFLLAPYFAWRRWVRKKASAPFGEKSGNVADRPVAPRIWIHAVSVGETTAAEPLVKALRASRPDLDVVISTTTVTGLETAIKRYGKERVFYYPRDFSWSVKRALDRVKPSVLVLMELEVWPNMTAEAARRRIPVVVLNGRITERSARRYRRFWFLAGPAFRRVQRWLVQSEEYAIRLKSLGVDEKTIEVAGNLKYDAIDAGLPAPEARSAARAALGIGVDAPVLVCGSIHPGEEVTLLKAYAQLRGGPIPNLRLILVPRHPEKAPIFEAAIRSAGFECLRRSSSKGGGEAGAVWLIDTVGEMKQMYSAADVAFVGGSLIPHGGQNVMEPCGMGIPALHGPHMHNFADAMEILRACQGSVEVSADTLRGELEKLLLNRAAALDMAARGRDAFLKRQGASKRSVEYLNSIIS